MEINKYTDIAGGVVRHDFVEGRMGVFSVQPLSFDFGSLSDLPGLRYPVDAAEAARAHFCVTWPVTNAQPFPGLYTIAGGIRPEYTFALRGGWDQAAVAIENSHMPIYITYPGNQNGVTIPSGYQALAFDRGVFTVPSGAYVYSANLVNPGAPLEVLNVADDGADAGKLAYNAAGTIAVTERYDSTTGALTFRTL